MKSKLTDSDLPVSPGFVEFLHHWIGNHPADTSWHDQIDESLVPADFAERRAAQGIG